jgi:hypothetical protein
MPHKGVVPVVETTASLILLLPHELGVLVRDRAVAVVPASGAVALLSFCEG